MGEEVKKKTQPSDAVVQLAKYICAKSLVKNALSPEWENRSKKKNPNHQMLFTAPDGWGYFWDGPQFVVQLAKSFVKNALSPEWEKRSKKN